MQVGYRLEQLKQHAYQTLQHCAFVENPKLEAELLLMHVLQQPRAYLYTWPEQRLDDEQVVQFRELCRQRLGGTPLAYLLGEREFWGLNLQVTPATLIPRADTETLVETALQRAATIASPKIADLGTGSGAIALALKFERPDAQITAVDLSASALEVARANSERLGLSIHFKQGSWCEPLAAMCFDLIVSNPPYIAEQDPHLDQGDLPFEPISALTSGADGLDAIRILHQQAWAHLNPNGWLILEHGYNQGPAVRALLQQRGYQAVETCCDYAGQERVTLGQKPV
ncbi:MAG: peptide chain release factor N(5)-glutamine methyltransferase [Thiotrichales bacterium]|nr:peptide chain release factor N(5)-glutamine methyltransferase [Thiotrichales bacterium]